MLYQVRFLYTYQTLSNKGQDKYHIREAYRCNLLACVVVPLRNQDIPTLPDELLCLAFQEYYLDFPQGQPTQVFRA